MFEHKADDHTTYIICDHDTAAWYSIFWLIGAIIKLCIFLVAALFAPVLILPLWGLNNSRDNTPGRGMLEMFRDHPYQCVFSFASLVSFAVMGVCFAIEYHITNGWELPQSAYVNTQLFQAVNPVFTNAVWAMLAIGGILVLMFLDVMKND
mgnify:FL=1